jgi:hypothetical protein
MPPCNGKHHGVGQWVGNGLRAPNTKNGFGAATSDYELSARREVGTAPSGYRFGQRIGKREFGAGSPTCGFGQWVGNDQSGLRAPNTSAERHDAARFSITAWRQ